MKQTSTWSTEQVSIFAYAPPGRFHSILDSLALII